MTLHIVDFQGNEGRISDDMSLTYAGPDEIAEQVETFLAELKADGMTAEEQMKSLVIELPQRTPIRSIEQIDDGSYDS